MSGVGEALQTARRARGITQEELADAAAITQAALSRYEHDLRTPEPDVLQRLAEVLGVTPAQERTSLYKQLSARRWRTNEPASDEIPPEEPRLATHIADALQAKGLTVNELASMAGFWSANDNHAFVPIQRRHLAPAPDLTGDPRS